MKKLNKWNCMPDNKEIKNEFNKNCNWPGIDWLQILLIMKYETLMKLIVHIYLIHL